MFPLVRAPMAASTWLGLPTASPAPPVALPLSDRDHRAMLAELTSATDLAALRADHAAVVRALRTVEWIGPDWRKGMVTQNIVNSCPYCHALTMPGLHDERCVIHAALSSPLAAAVSDQEPTT